MEDNKKKKKYPSIPPNYVTLVQLQEKWNKEQQRKQKEKEKQQQQQLKAEEQPIRRNNNWKFRPNNRNTVEKPVVAAVFVVVEKEKENESASAKEVNSEESSSSKKKKKKKQKKEQQWRKQKKEENQSRAEEVKEEGEAHAPPENENVPVRRAWEKKEIRREFRPKSANNNNAVVVQSEGSQSESVVEIEPKFGDLSMNTTRSEEGKNDRFVRENANFNRGSERRGGYREMPRTNMVWVKKGEVNVDGNHSSSSSVKAGFSDPTSSAHT